MSLSPRNAGSEFVHMRHTMLDSGSAPSLVVRLTLKLV